MNPYIPPEYQQQLPPPPEMRPRGYSNSAMNRYVPDNLQPQVPAPRAQSQGARPRGPSLNGQQIALTPPVANNSTPYFNQPVIPHPQNQLQPPYPNSPNQTSYQQPPYPDENGYMRPPPDQRRASASSTRSHHSQHSHHSHDGRRSHHSRRSSNSRYDDRPSYERHKSHKHHRHEEADRDLKPLKRENTHPTLGDTMYSIFDIIKSALGPRDKY